jgi:GTPase SAR1 family protein
MLMTSVKSKSKGPTKLEIWDTPSSTKLAPLVKSYYNSIQGALVVYDPRLPSTLDYAYQLMADLPATVQKVLVANKTDLGPVSSEGVGVSAKTGEHVKEVFLHLAG